MAGKIVFESIKFMMKQIFVNIWNFHSIFFWSNEKEINVAVVGSWIRNWKMGFKNLISSSNFSAKFKL